MPTAWLDLPAPPALPGLFLRAALRRGIRGKALPERGLRSQVTVDPKHLERYRQVCGFRDDGLLPPTYPHILAFPLQMALLTDKRFPFRCSAWSTWRTASTCCARSAASARSP